MEERELKELADLIADRIAYCTEEVLTSEDAARYLGVSKSCLYQWTSGRKIPYYKPPLGKLLYFRRDEIEQWALSNRVPPIYESEGQKI